MSIDLETLLRESISKVIFDLFNVTLLQDEIHLEETRKEFEGDFTFTAFALTKFSKKSPEETARIIGEKLLSEVKEITAFQVVKGFLNLSISDESWLNFFSNIKDNHEYGYALNDASTPHTLIEYCGPNTNKPLHVGHLRNILIGHSIYEIAKANALNPVKVNIVNDRGIHICKSMLAWKKYGNGETPSSSGMKGDHLVGKYYVLFDKHNKKEKEEIVALMTDFSLRSGKEINKEFAEKNTHLMLEVQEMLRKWEEGEPETIGLWKMMNDWVYDGFEQTYKMLGVDFEETYYESNTYIEGKKMLGEYMKTHLDNKKIKRKEDGSVWIDLTDKGLDEKLLLRADGTSVYITQDIGTALQRYNKYHFNKMIYVVANEQDYHFKVLKLTLKEMGYKWAEAIYHLSYGMVELPSGKMKSREGTVVDADDLIDEMIEAAKRSTIELGKLDNFEDEEAQKLYKMIGLGALKYFILKVDPKKKMLFNPEESIDLNGNTGPFIQYTHARIKSLLRKAASTNPESSILNPQSLTKLNAKEKEVIILLYKFPKVIKEAYANYNPSEIANYVYELAKQYNQFYHEYPVIQEEDKDVANFRLILSEVTGRVIKTGMNLLGIDVPEKM